ncbi:MAG: VOC family protein [Pseudomonadales bacterium]
MDSETTAGQPVAEVFPLVWTTDVPALVDWAVGALGLVEAWRAPPNDAGEIEHAELCWIRGRISLNLQRPGKAAMGPAGISLRVDDRARVEALYRRAVAAGASITQGPEETRIAYSFTATDRDGNQWWVNAETGFLDRLRGR